MSERAVHTFDNGVRVYTDHLNPPQLERYSRCNVHEEDEEPVFVELVTGLPTDGVYVALGSAIGYYAILARKHAPRLAIHAFEPLPLHQRYLRENLALNGLPQGDVPIHSEAVAERDGSTWLVEDSYSSALEGELSLERRVKEGIRRTLAVVGLRSLAPPRRTQVATLSLDSIVARVGGRIDLLQMDVQGVETAALRGGARSLASGACRTLLISTHGPDIHVECRSLLESHGYSITYDDPDPGVQPDGMLVAVHRPSTRP